MSSNEEEEEDYDYIPPTTKTNNNSKKSRQIGSSDEGENSEESSFASESEAEFTDSEQEGEKVKAGSKKRKTVAKKAKSSEKRSRFLDTEAQVGDETDEDDEAGADGFLDDFIADEDEAEEAAIAAREASSRHGNYPKQDYAQDFDAEAEEQRLRALYSRQALKSSSAASAHRPTSIPRPFLLPTVTDPKLWLCRAQQGRERAAALALLRVVMERQYSGQPLQIFSIIARDGLKGYVYIEAHKPAQIALAIETAKLNHCLYPGQAGKSLLLVPLAEMPQVLQTTAASGNASSSTTEIPDIGSLVRVKRGRYANDLAQVVDNTQDEGSYDPANLNTCIIRLKILPRLNFNSSNTSTTTTARIPPRQFDPEEASRFGPVSKSRGFWIFGGETYRDGFLFKNIRLSSLTTTAVSPSVEELARFPDADQTSQSEGSTAATLVSLVPGDQVIVLEGEMRNLLASVDSLEWKPNPATGKPEQTAHLVADAASTGLTGQSARFSLKVSQVRKIFAVGAQVRIHAGPHAGESGIVVAIDQKTKNVIVFAAGSNQQISLPASLCILATNTDSESPQKKKTSATSSSNDFSLNDLVQFQVDAIGEEGVGVVVRILDTENSVAVFDSLGQVRTLSCKSVSLLANFADNSNNNNRTNHFASPASNELSQGDRVIEVSSSNGNIFKLLHIYKSLAFVKPISSAATNTTAIAVLPLEAICKPRPQVPNFRNPNAPQSSGPVGHFIGKSITITSGPRKGYVGFVKQVSDGIARVELHTNGKIVNVPVDKLALVNPGKNTHSDQRNHNSNSSQHFPDNNANTPAWNSASSSSRTPAWNSGGASSSSRTPAWNSAAARTPGWNPSTSSSRTPAWNPSTSSSRTPAWNPSSSGLTPAWNVPTAIGQSNTAANWQKGSTPAWNSTSSRTPAWSSNNNNKQQQEQQQKDSDSKQPWDQVNSWKKDKE